MLTLIKCRDTDMGRGGKGEKNPTSKNKNSKKQNNAKNPNKQEDKRKIFREEYSQFALKPIRCLHDFT